MGDLDARRLGIASDQARPAHSAAGYPQAVQNEVRCGARRPSAEVNLLCDPDWSYSRFAR